MYSLPPEGEKQPPFQPQLINSLSRPRSRLKSWSASLLPFPFYLTLFRPFPFRTHSLSLSTLFPRLFILFFPPLLSLLLSYPFLCFFFFFFFSHHSTTINTTHSPSLLLSRQGEPPPPPLPAACRPGNQRQPGWPRAVFAAAV